MLRFKNPKVKIDRVLHEIVWITEFADHIAKNHYDKHDSAKHLNFEQIQDIVLNYELVTDDHPPYMKFFKRLPDGKEYVVVAIVQEKRVVPKSGRINNFGNKLKGVRK